MVGCCTRFYCSTKHSNFMGMQYKDVQPQTQIFSFKWSAFSFILVTIVLFQWKIYFCFISKLKYFICKSDNLEKSTISIFVLIKSIYRYIKTIEFLLNLIRLQNCKKMKSHFVFIRKLLKFVF